MDVSTFEKKIPMWIGGVWGRGVLGYLSTLCLSETRSRIWENSVCNALASQTLFPQIRVGIAD